MHTSIESVFFDYYMNIISLFQYLLPLSSHILTVIKRCDMTCDCDFWIMHSIRVQWYRIIHGIHDYRLYQIKTVGIHFGACTLLRSILYYSTTVCATKLYTMNFSTHQFVHIIFITRVLITFI